MPQAARQITISAPADRVFGYVADLTRHPVWAGHVTEIRQTSTGPAAPSLRTPVRWAITMRG